MSTGCALDENWVNIVVKNSPLFLLGIHQQNVGDIQIV